MDDFDVQRMEDIFSKTIADFTAFENSLVSQISVFPLETSEQQGGFSKQDTTDEKSVLVVFKQKHAFANHSDIQNSFTNKDKSCLVGRFVGKPN